MPSEGPGPWRWGQAVRSTARCRRNGQRRRWRRRKTNHVALASYTIVSSAAREACHALRPGCAVPLPGLIVVARVIVLEPPKSRPRAARGRSPLRARRRGEGRDHSAASRRAVYSHVSQFRAPVRLPPKRTVKCRTES